VTARALFEKVGPAAKKLFLKQDNMAKALWLPERPFLQLDYAAGEYRLGAISRSDPVARGASHSQSGARWDLDDAAARHALRRTNRASCRGWGCGAGGASRTRLRDPASSTTDGAAAASPSPPM